MKTNRQGANNAKFLQRLAQSLGKTEACPVPARPQSRSAETREALNNMIEFNKPWRPWRLGG